MPIQGPRICTCGRLVRGDAMCICPRARKAEADARRPNSRDRGYDTSWDTERTAFLKVNPRCKRCDGQASVVDHIRAHRGNMREFWDRSNWQPLCTTCHARWKQAQEHRTAWAVNT